MGNLTNLTVWLPLMLAIVFGGLTSSNSLEDFGNRFTRTTKKTLRKSEQACVDYGAGFQRKVFPSKYALPGEYQHNAALAFKGEGENEISWRGCNGVLISEYYILTVAHCLLAPHVTNQTPVKVRLGSIDLTGKEDEAPPQDIAVEKAIIYPEYDRINKKGDIALLRLKEPAKFDRHVQPACLYTKSDIPVNMVSVGWGRLTQSGDFSDMLLKSNVRMLDQDTCNKTYVGIPRHTSLDLQMCGKLTESDICHMGSGSSVFIPNDEDSRVTVVGITSFGIGCSNLFADVYTNIYKYLDWIEDNVWPENKSNSDVSV